MSFLLKIQVSYDEPNKRILATELAVSESSWGDGTNPTRGEVTSAFILIRRNDELQGTSVDVKSEIQAGTLVDKVILENVDKDGAYIIHLSVNTNPPAASYNSELELLLVTTIVKTWISKFWAKHACTSNLERQKGIYDVVSKLEILLSALQSLSIIHQRAECIEILDIIQKTIKLNNHLLK